MPHGWCADHMISLGMSEIVLWGYNASALLCTAIMWLCSVVNERAVFCCYDNQGKVPPSMKDGCPNMAHQFLAVLLFTFSEFSTGLLALACVDRVLWSTPIFLIHPYHLLRSCGLNVRLVQWLRRVLEGDEGVFIDNKDDWMINKVKRFKSFRFTRAKGTLQEWKLSQA